MPDARGRNVRRRETRGEMFLRDRLDKVGGKDRVCGVFAGLKREQSLDANVADPRPVEGVIIGIAERACFKQQLLGGDGCRHTTGGSAGEHVNLDFFIGRRGWIAVVLADGIDDLV